MGLGKGDGTLLIGPFASICGESCPKHQTASETLCIAASSAHQRASESTHTQTENKEETHT